MAETDADTIFYSPLYDIILLGLLIYHVNTFKKHIQTLLYIQKPHPNTPLVKSRGAFVCAWLT